MEVLWGCAAWIQIILLLCLPPLQRARALLLRFWKGGRGTGESKGITEDGVEEKDDGNLVLSDDDYDESGDGIETWQPSLKGCLKYLADSKFIFSTVEKIIDEPKQRCL